MRQWWSQRWLARSGVPLYSFLFHIGGVVHHSLTREIEPLEHLISLSCFPSLPTSTSTVTTLLLLVKKLLWWCWKEITTLIVVFCFGKWDWCFSLFLGPWIKRRKKKKIKKKIVARKPKKIYSSKKKTWGRPKMAKDWLRKFKNTKIEIWQYIIDWWRPY